MATTQFRKAARIILVGAPGVGKGTQAERLMQRFPQLSSLSSGDLLRDAVRHRTRLGLQVEQAIKSGNLVPDDTILKLILAELKSRGWMSSKAFVGDRLAAEPSQDPSASFILDGFPRTATQASQLDTIVPINLVVSLITPVDIILSRIASRWIHAPSGRVYNTDFNAPKEEGKDDVTGEPLTQRADDSEETWKLRLKKFEETSASLLDHYDRKGMLWTVVGNSSDEISPKLFLEFQKRFS